MRTASTRWIDRSLEAAGALACALAVAFGAYAAHGLEAHASARMQPALFYLFLHGLAVVLLARRRRSRLELAALGCWSAGMLLFCGSLIAAVLLRWPTTLAPLGGILLIAGWLWQAIAAICRTQEPGEMLEARERSERS